MVGALDAAKDKPAAEPVFLALEGSGLQPGPDVWFVGDSLTDMQCAHGSGCLPVLIRPEPLASEGAGAYPPALTLPDCHALKSIIHERTIPMPGEKC